MTIIGALRQRLESDIVLPSRYFLNLCDLKSDTALDER